MGFHKELIDSDIHVIHAFTFADATTRNSATVVTADIGKICKQTDGGSYYILIDIAPTWAQINTADTDIFIGLTDTPSSFVEEAGKVVQVNVGETGVEFGQKLRTTDSPIFAELTANSILVGVAIPLNTTHRSSDGKDHSDVVLNNIHRVSDGSDHIFIDQSVVVASSPTFVDLVLTGNLTVSSNIIIGSTSVNPDGALHVHVGSSGAVTASSVANALVIEDSTNNGISILTPAANSGRIVFGSPSDLLEHFWHGVIQLMISL